MDKMRPSPGEERMAFQREGELLGTEGKFNEDFGVPISELQNEICATYGTPGMNDAYEQLFHEYAKLAGLTALTLSTVGETGVLDPSSRRSKAALQRSFLLRLAGVTNVPDWEALIGSRVDRPSAAGKGLIAALDARRGTYLLRKVFENSNDGEDLKLKRLMAHIAEKTGLTWKTLFAPGGEPLYMKATLRGHSTKHESPGLTELLELYAAALDSPRIKDAIARTRMPRASAASHLNGKRPTFSDEAIRLITARLKIPNLRESGE